MPKKASVTIVQKMTLSPLRKIGKLPPPPAKELIAFVNAVNTARPPR